jgi:hypothetical protein
MGEPNDPKGSDLRPFAINVVISLAVMVLMLQVYAALHMV